MPSDPDHYSRNREAVNPEGHEPHEQQLGRKTAFAEQWLTNACLAAGIPAATVVTPKSAEISTKVANRNKMRLIT